MARGPRLPIIGDSFVSVQEPSAQHGYFGSHIRDLLGKVLVRGVKFAGVWLVYPGSVERIRAQMEWLGNRKHGTWADESRDRGLGPSERSGCEIGPRACGGGGQCTSTLALTQPYPSHSPRSELITSGIDRIVDQLNPFATRSERLTLSLGVLSEQAR
jgi:hypothetical protein